MSEDLNPNDGENFPEILPEQPQTGGSVPIPIEEEMRASYLAYAMSVIVARALPDVRDGLKPVHRRILYGMKESGFTSDKPYRKTARAVGDVMGKFHPHGDMAIYDALVRLAQHWSMRVMLIDGQGNFGSVDGDSPAAMRYTEARLAKSARFLLEDIDRETVHFRPNYDESEMEPEVLPAAFPNLLVNGASGIAVGMATNIPPHNPGEIIDAALALIDDPGLGTEALMQIVPGPDFPTGAIIMGRSGIREAYETGRGSIPVRARAAIEEIRRDRQAIIVTEIPYQVNKAALQEKMAELVKAKTVEGISDIRDESDRSGMRIVIELKRDATPEVVLNQLYRFTQLQTTFPVNMIALDGGRPRLMGLKDVLEAFLSFREDVILRRTRFELGKARERGHILIGLALAVANIDEVIALIRQAPDAAAARTALMGRSFNAEGILPLLKLVDEAGNRPDGAGRVFLTEVQARGILELRLQRLTGLEQEKIASELGQVGERIAELLHILDSRPRLLEVMREELAQARAALAVPRITEISDALGDETDESLIEPGQMVVTITRDGFIKRTPLDIFRAQNRGGKGRSGMGTRGDDVVTRSFNAHTHQWVVFFSKRGKAYRLKVWRLPEAAPAAKGRALVNLLPDLGGEEITAVLPLPQEEELWDNLHLVFATSSGNVRRNRLSDFANIRSSGLIAMKLDGGDQLIGVDTCREGEDIFLATARGRAIRFPIREEVLRIFAGRNSTGVRGIRLEAGDSVVSLSVLPHVEAAPEERLLYLKEANARRRLQAQEENDGIGEAGAEISGEEDEEHPDSVEGALREGRFEELAAAEQTLLTVTDAGFGRRSSSYDYRTTGRAGKGVLNMNLANPKRGAAVVATLPVLESEQLMLVTDQGKLIRLPLDQVRIMSRSAAGVTLFNVDDGERVISAFTVTGDDMEDETEAPGDQPQGAEPGSADDAGDLAAS